VENMNDHALAVDVVHLEPALDLSPKLRQTVKTHFSLNGELSHGEFATEFHEGV